MKQEKKNTLVYIAGTNYSGTTLLTSILGCHPEIESAGQLFELSDYIENNRLCMCGKNLSDCGFWAAVIGGMEYTKSVLLSKLKTSSEFSYGGVIQSKLGLVLPRHPKDVQLYRELSKQLLHQIQKVSGRRTIVDSSKNPHRLHWLVRSGVCLDLDLKVISMTRHGYGVMASYQKRGRGSLRSAAAWVWRNRAVEKIVGETVGERNLTLKYENLCEDPVGTLKRICNYIGIEFRGEMLDFRSRLQHQIGGNPMRFDKSSQITADKKWEGQLGPRERLIFDFVAGRKMKQYGY